MNRLSSYKAGIWAALCLLLLLGGLFWEAERLLFITDISTQPIDREATPDVVRKGEELKRDPVYFVTYADGHEVFFRNQNALAFSALGKGVDVIFNYKRSMLDPAFIEENEHIFSQKRGAGYWLWKPWIIRDVMRRAPENAVIVYLDGGAVIHHSLAPLIELAQQYDVVLAAYENSAAEETTKREVFQRLGCDTFACHQSPALWAGFVMVRNNARGRAFVAAWLQYAVDPQLLIEGETGAEELPGFKQHMHDQAILQVLYARDPKGKKLVPYQAELMKNYVAWPHRRPGAHADDTYALQVSSMPKIFSLRGIERLFYNAPFLLRLRGADCPPR